MAVQAKTVQPTVVNGTNVDDLVVLKPTLVVEDRHRRPSVNGGARSGLRTDVRAAKDPACFLD